MDSREEKILQDAATVNAQLREHQRNEELGITQDYNAENRQKLWDSEKDKKIARNSNAFSHLKLFMIEGYMTINEIAVKWNLAPR